MTARAMRVAPAMSERTLRASSAASAERPGVRVASPSPTTVTLTREKSARCLSSASSARTAARVARALERRSLTSAISSAESASASWDDQGVYLGLGVVETLLGADKGAVMSSVPSLRAVTLARSERSAWKACRFWVGTRRAKTARRPIAGGVDVRRDDDPVVALGHLDHAVGDVVDLVGLGGQGGRDRLLLDAGLARLDLLDPLLGEIIDGRNGRRVVRSNVDRVLGRRRLPRGATGAFQAVGVGRTAQAVGAGLPARVAKRVDADDECDQGHGQHSRRGEDARRAEDR